MLNDLSGFTRLSTFFQLAPLGLFVGAMPSLGDGRVFLLCFGLGLLLEVAWCVGFLVAIRRIDARMKKAVAVGSAELVGAGAAGSVAGTPVLGRAVRTRRAKGYDAFLVDPGRIAAPADIVVFTAIGDGAPRRVAALVPATFKLPAGLAALLLAHPEQREVAVLESRATPAQLAGAAADPRWQTEPLPTDRSVVGGWPALVVVGIAGVVAGALVALGIGAALS